MVNWGEALFFNNSHMVSGRTKGRSRNTWETIPGSATTIRGLLKTHINHHFSMTLIYLKLMTLPFSTE